MTDADTLASPPVAEPVDLSRLTLDEVVAALMAGRPVRAGKAGEQALSLPDGARKALAFYAARARRSLWDVDKPDAKSANIREEEITALLDALDGALPATAPSELPSATDPPHWRLVGLTIRQFGGLHAHCDPDGQAPPDLTAPCDAPISVLVGQNGAGKSQTARALSWGLTGQTPRTHAEPAPFETLINEYRSVETDGAAVTLPVIVPVPSADHLAARDGMPLLATAVTMVFENLIDGERRTLRRQISGGRPFSSTIHLVGERDSPVAGVAAALGASQLSIEAGVLMAAKLPFIRLDGPNALTHGIAALTGVAPLKRLGERIGGRVSDWLGKSYPQKRRAEFKAMTPRFKEARQALLSALEAMHPPVVTALPETPQEQDGGKAYADALTRLDTALSGRECDAQAVMLTATGLTIVPREIGVLLTDLTEALGVCSAGSVAERVANKLAPWRAVSAADAAVAARLRDEIVADANAFAALDADRRRAARLRLYAALRAWAAANDADGADGAWPPDACPVCATPLVGRTDAALNRDISAAMLEAARVDAARHADAQAWEQAALARLEAGLPDGVRALLAGTRSQPADALRQAFAEELIRVAGLSAGTFVGLGERFRDAVMQSVGDFPPLPAITAPGLPDPLAGGNCAQRLQALSAALAETEWVRASAPAVETLVRLVAPGPESGVKPPFVLADELTRIDNALRAHLPLKAARDAAMALTGLKGEWDGVLRNLKRSLTATSAVAPLAELVGLVDAQVGALMEDLRVRTGELCDSMYRPTNTAGPELAGAEIAQGVLIRKARFAGMVGDGGEILNASRDRAWLFAFSIALLEKIRARDGGLTLLLLDDPQALFDETNQRTLATGLGKLPTANIHPFIVTFSRHFAAALGRNADAGLVRSFEIAPRSSMGLRADIRPLLLELERTRSAWRDDDQRNRAIVDFCGEARRYLEETLCNLIWSSRVAVDGTQSMGFLFDKLRGLTKRGAPYTQACFTRFLDHSAWQDNTFKEALNWSHHGVSNELTPGHATALDDCLDDILGIIEECQKAMDRVTASGRLPANDAPHPMVAVAAQAFPKTTIHVQGLLAARDRASVDDASAAGSADPIIIDPERYALYTVGRGAEAWLSPFFRAGDVLVVRRDAHVADGLVTMFDQGKAFPGWLCSRGSGAAFLAGRPGHDFCRECDPSRHPVYPVVGVLFRAGVSHGGVLEACDTALALNKIVSAAGVNGRSAEPLVSSRGYALIGDRADGWPAEADAVVAVTVSGQEHLLKRMGRRLDTEGHVRMLDSLGSAGESLAVRMPGRSCRGFEGLPEIEAIHPLHGLWF